MANPQTSPPLTPEGVRSASSKIQRHIHKTPVLTSRSLSAIASSPDPRVYLSENPPPFPDTDASGNNGNVVNEGVPQFHLYFKADNFQKIGAFKARGAFHAVVRLMDEVGVDEVRKRGVVTHSSGNHAQALALAASTFSIPSYIVMPTISTPSKIAGVRLYTPNVIFSGSTSEEREAVVEKVIAEHGAILVPPYDHPDIILGQGTSALELEGQVGELRAQDETRSHGSRPVLDAVITPLGGGGMLGGTATWFSETPETLVFGAEPSFQGGDDGRRGLEQGKRIESVKTLTIADGLRTPVGVVNWGILSDQSKVQAVYAVTEQEIKMALRLVLERVKVVVEPSAVVGLAVILFNHDFRKMVAKKQSEAGDITTTTDRAWHMGVIFTGGNTTVKALSALFKDEQSTDKEQRAEGTVGLDGSKKVENVAG